MSQPDGPWSRIPPKPQAPKPGPRLRLGAWLLIVGLVCAGILGLSLLFPGRMSNLNDWGPIAQGVLLIAVVSLGLLTRGLRLRQVFRDLAIWTAVILLAVLAYSFRGEAGALFGRLRSELIPSYAVTNAAKEVVIGRDQSGGFYVTGQIDGKPVRFLVDTGASDIVLSPADAARLGVDRASLQFNHPVETANGPGLGAPYTAPDLAIGPIRMTQVPMSVNQAAMSTSLLGMAFFNRLQSFRVEGDRLYLKSRP